MNLRTLAVSLAFAAGGTAFANPPLVPEYRLSFSDASQLRKALDENAWAKELQQSNLYRGLVLRLAPALFSLDEKKEGTWQGRLVDYLLEKVLQKKRLNVFYYHYPGLVSPFGALVQDLGEAEQAVAKLMISRMQPMPATVEVEIEPGKDGKKKDTVTVRPLQHKFQKFAAVLAGGCLAVSRDPQVAANVSRQCGKKIEGEGAALEVDLKEFYPAWYPVLSKVFGVGSRANVQFAWESSGARFVPKAAKIDLKGTNLVGTGKVPEKLLSALPADAQFFAVGFLPDPGPLSSAAVAKYLQAPPKGSTAVPMVLVHLGMKAGPGGKPQAMTAVLLPQKDTGNQLFQDVEELFSEKGYYEVRYRRICGEYLALSPSDAALERMDEACNGKRPSLKNASPGFVKALTGEGISAGFYLNPASVLASSLDYGWEVASGSDASSMPIDSNALAAAEAKAGPPPELSDAKALVAKLPPVLFAGKAGKESLNLTGAKP